MDHSTLKTLKPLITLKINPMVQQVSLRVARPLQESSGAAGNAGGLALEGAVLTTDEVAVLKLLLRPPRGNTVRARHSLGSLKSVKFAEAVHVSGCTGRGWACE